MEYYIYGNTFNIKEDLKAWACTWVPEKKCWKTIDINKDDFDYQRIKSLCDAVGAEMIPIKLSGECQKIQDILKGKNHERV